MTFDSHGVRTLGALAIFFSLVACDSGSVGEFESDDGGATSGASSGASSESGSTSASGTTGTSESATSTSGGGSSTTDATSATSSGTETGGGSESSSGGAVGLCAGIENHTCSGPAECGESCGELDSMFDDNGCARQPCSTHAECGDGGFCYRPQDYGGCQSSDVSCFEGEDDLCYCATDPDCSGAYCVPEEIVFEGATPGPTDGWATDTCAPNDGPAFVVRVGTYISNACGGQFDEEEVLIEFQVGAPLGTTGTFISGDDTFFQAVFHAGDGSQVPATGVLSISAADGFIDGEYEVMPPDGTVLYGAFSAISCAQKNPVPCG